ncbi:rod shape-determining protein [Geochorda subterranea]|uniref:Cell shape-determining protein MreB n=1 Tax=Geochorda subterranea TaxID=3109564 RepID=A0ABZ1BQ12_9FIRM|nr:rod shape-determining protein [Limnochorda sp. LNt]WRP14906.1 rod shape-determining protein [Limnochorda sp. LNt]
MLSTDVGIDLGTSTVLVFVRGRGVVVHEPSIVAVDRRSGAVVAVGSQALAMLGRTPDSIRAVRPLRDGVVASYEVTLQMLIHLLRAVSGPVRWSRPRAAVCLPSVVTDVERRAVVEACRAAGAREVLLVSEPMAAALGADMPVHEVRGHLIVDVGGGTTDVAVISMGQEVVSDSVRVAGDHMDDAIARHLRRTYGLEVGERTAEEVKRTVGTADPDEKPAPARSMEVRGRDVVTGLPRSVTVTDRSIAAVLAEPIGAIISGIRAALERTPPELAADIAGGGLLLTGGGALLPALDRVIERETGLAARVADDPVGCVARGTGKVLETLRRARPLAPRFLA